MEYSSSHFYITDEVLLVLTFDSFRRAINPKNTILDISFIIIRGKLHNLQGKPKQQQLIRHCFYSSSFSNYPGILIYSQ